MSLRSRDSNLYLQLNGEHNVEMHVYYSHCVGISLSLSLVLFHFMSSNWRIYSGILNGFHSLGFMQIANFIDCICNHSIAFHQNSSDSFSYCIERYREAWREAKVFGSEITAIPTEWGYSSLACRSFFFCVSCVGFFFLHFDVWFRVIQNACSKPKKKT